MAEGKLPLLLESGAIVSVISPKATEIIRSAAQQGKLEWLKREYRPGDLEGAFLGIAATNKRAVNQEIFQEADGLGVLLNVVDDPPMCTFIAPAVVRRDPVTVAISTGGTSPALARKLREELTNHPVLDWADLAGVLARARREVKKRRMVVDPIRWQCCITGEILRLAQAGKKDDALTLLLSTLLDESKPELCPQLGKCLPDACQVRHEYATHTAPHSIGGGDTSIG